MFLLHVLPMLVPYLLSPSISIVFPPPFPVAGPIPKRTCILGTNARTRTDCHLPCPPGRPLVDRTAHSQREHATRSSAPVVQLVHWHIGACPVPVNHVVVDPAPRH